MKTPSSDMVEKALASFLGWLDRYGETSYDHQCIYSGKFGGRIKAYYYKKPALGTLAVAPLVFCDSFMPSARRFLCRKNRFPIADAQYAMGFAYLDRAKGNGDHRERTRHYLDVLMQTRCRGYQNYCWGYPFDWVTKTGTIEAGTPLITTTPYAYEAFSEAYAADRDEKWLHVLQSIIQHVLNDIRDFEITPDASSCAYSPRSDDHGGVINASAYRAFLLTHASALFSEERYWKVAEKNLNFVLQSQLPNGSWPYSIDSATDFIDHFHTCFVLKALAKIEKLTGHEGCRKAVEKGVEYYVKELFDEKGLPKPYSKAPRLTVYRRVLYDYAECINLGGLLKGRSDRLDNLVLGVLDDLLNRWQTKQGSFRARELFWGWDSMPMHRYAQSQVFRSLAFLIHQETKASIQ